MTRRHYSNLAPARTIAGSLTNVATTISVTPSLSGFPSSFPYTVAIDRATASEELVLVTSAAGATATMTRGYGGTSATAHTVGAAFEHVVDATDADEANSHVNATTGVHGATGAVVGTTDSQTVTGKTFSTNTNLATSTDPGLKTQAASTGTASQIQTLDSAGTTTLFKVARDGATTCTSNLAASTILLAKGAAAQSGPYIDVQTSAAASLFQVDSAGRLVHKPSSITSSQAYKLVPPDSTTRNAIVLRTTDDASDQFILDTSGAITTMSTAKLRGFFSDDVLRYPVDGSLFKVDSTGVVTAVDFQVGGDTLPRGFVSRATGTTTITSTGSEQTATALTQAVTVVSGRHYKVTVTGRMQSTSGAATWTAKIKGSANSPALIQDFDDHTDATTGTGQTSVTYVGEFAATGSGTCSISFTITQTTGGNVTFQQPSSTAYKMLIEDIGS
jgi:hypothetical protein